jgi:outer membrane protein TolC
MKNLWRQKPAGKLRALFALGCSLSVGASAVAAHIAVAQSAQELPQAPTPNPAVLRAPLSAPGNMLVEAATAGPLPLSLDDAISRGVRLNLQQLLAQQNERIVHGELLTVANNLLPTLTAQLQSGDQEINLAALGFKPSTVAAIAPALGLGNFTFDPITKVATTSAQVNLSQQLFNLPAYEFYRAAQKAATVAALTTRNGRNDLALRVGTAYLQAIADNAQIANAEALENADQVVLHQATLSHDAGVGTHLDVLRAQVQLQTQQQVRIRAENTFAKDKIALNRLIGLPADQQITLTDTVPFAEFAAMAQPEALQLALTQRDDYLALQAQLDVNQHSAKAIRYQRLPSLAFGGYYGVLGVTNGLYHGNFTAQGKLEFPIFQEGSLRGEREVANAQISRVRSQIANLRDNIDQQIRDSQLDVQSSAELVKVARSNVDLSSQELRDATDRFTSGVTDNLPVVQAQATLAAAQTRQIQSEFQYNQSKLALARSIGVIETQYKTYLGR